MSIRSKLGVLSFVVLFAIGCQQTVEPVSEPMEEVVITLFLGEYYTESDDTIVDSLNVSKEKLSHLLKILAVSYDWRAHWTDPPTPAPQLSPFAFELILDSSGPSPIKISCWESCDVVYIDYGETARFGEVRSPEGINLLTEIYNSALRSNKGGGNKGGKDRK